MKTARLINIFIVVFVDLLGFSLILPLLPYYAEKFGATPVIIGLLTASYAAASLLGAPLMGRLSDRFGRRPVLLASVAGTFLGFLILGFAEPIGRGLANLIAPAAANAFILGILFFSRVVDGLTGGNITVAQAYISDVTDEKNRARGLGLIGAAFGLGFIIGPAVGGLLSRGGDYSLPAFAAAGLSFLNLLSIFFFLPESLTDELRKEMGERQRPPVNFQALVAALRRPVVGPLLTLRLLYGLAFATFQSIFALYAQVKLGLTADKTGYILAYVGILSVLVQGVGIGFLTKRFRETWLIMTSLWVLGGALLAWAFTPNLLVLLIVMLPMALAGGVLNTVIQSAITKAISRDELGGTLGLSTSLEALTRVIAPTAGGFLLENLGTWAPGLMSAILMGWAVTFAYRNLILKKEAGASAKKQRRLIHTLNWSLYAGMALVIVFVAWGATPPRPMPEALNALQSDSQVTVTSSQWLTFTPTGESPTTGLILYPGGRVDYRSYAPAAHAIAAEGYLVVITRAPLNLAVLHPGAASDVILAHPEIQRWAIGGHSLGGTMAANFTDTHPGAVQALILLASYPSSSDDLSQSDLKVLSISGTLDGLSTPEKIEASRALLPADTTWVIIQGGNHAQFGWYGEQAGDNPASISRSEQQAKIVNATVNFLENLK